MHEKKNVLQLVDLFESNESFVAIIETSKGPTLSDIIASGQLYSICRENFARSVLLDLI